MRDPLLEGGQAKVLSRPEPGMRHRIERNVQEIEAYRNFWIADADLVASTFGTGPDGNVNVLGSPHI